MALLKPEIRDLPIASLKPAPYNPRRIDDAAMAALTKSLERFGYVEPIIWNERTGHVVGGHQRLKVLMAAKADSVPVVVVDLDETDEKALNVALNSPFLTGQFTDDLQALLADIQESDSVLFSELRLNNLLEQMNPSSALTDPDSVPEIPKEPKTKPGDLYILGRHKLLCGDSTNSGCLDRLMNGDLAALVFTDPPYGVRYDGGTTVRDKLVGDDSMELYGPCCEMAFRHSNNRAPLYLWHAGVKGIAAAAAAAAAAAGYDIRCEIVWNKNQAQFGALSAQYKQKHEPAYYCVKRGSPPRWFGPTNEVTVWDIDRASVNEFHPTQKPVPLASRAIKNSSAPDDSVLDLFGGSGSTLIACEIERRKAYLIEISPLYCDVIVKRWEDFTGKKAVLHHG